jgi:hypothetical protein
VQTEEADGITHATPMQPSPRGAAGSAPADAGLFLVSGGVTVASYAVRNLVLGITGAPSVIEPSPLPDTTFFSVSDYSLTVLSGTVDFRIPILGRIGSADLTGIVLPPSGDGYIHPNQLINIPVNVSLPFETASGQLNTLLLTGAIVTTTGEPLLIPEPGTAVLGSLALLGLLLRRRRSVAARR